jgi:sugar phosphate isomerase/epimerase
VALRGGDLVLCSGTLRRGAPFAERLDAASAGGFAGVSLWGRDYQEARDGGLSDRDLRAMLDDHGLAVAELDPVWWWLPGAAEVQIPPEFDTEDIFRFREAELFAVAEALGARSVNAVDIFGGTWSTEDAAASFAALCRRAAEHGLLVHLEFLPWSRIPDLRAAWTIVRAADEPNGGLMLDAWHYFRSSPDDALLRSLPGHRVTAVQLSDAPGRPESNLLEATLHQRLLPGEGELDLGSLLSSLRMIGAVAPIGVEVFSDGLHRLDPVEAGRLAGASARQLLHDAGGASSAV